MPQTAVHRAGHHHDHTKPWNSAINRIKNEPSTSNHIKLDNDIYPVKPEPNLSQGAQGPFYVVTQGRRPGIYNDEAEARAAISTYSDNTTPHVFHNRSTAITYLRPKGFTNNTIRFFRSTFIAAPGYTPNPSTPFNQEFKTFALSQNLPPSTIRALKTTTIRDEIIRYYLPDGVRFNASREEDEDENADLDDDEFLEIYQRMCGAARKTVHPTIHESLLELKGSPYVNILDFIDTFRTGKKMRTFKEWDDFVEYTKKGHRVDVQYARENEFLAPLLQHLTLGPGAIDPISVHEEFMYRRDERRREREEKMAREVVKEEEEGPTIVNVSQDLPRSLSPSVFDAGFEYSSSLPTTPSQTQDCAVDELPQFPLFSKTSVSPSRIDPRNPPQRPSSPFATPSDISDSDLIELSMRVEASTQIIPLPARTLKSPSPESDISDSDLIELSMRLEASTQDVASPHKEAASILQKKGKVSSSIGKRRLDTSPPRVVRRSKRSRKNKD